MLGLAENQIVELDMRFDRTESMEEAYNHSNMAFKHQYGIYGASSQGVDLKSIDLNDVRFYPIHAL